MHFEGTAPIDTGHRSFIAYREPLRTGPTAAGLEAEVSGNAVGTGSEPLLVALGEFLERRHFMSDVPTHSLCALSEYGDRGLATSVATALGQTATSTGAEKLARQPFAHTQCRRLRTYDPVLLPRCLISLSDQEGDLGRQLMPHRDSSGCALHRTAEASRQSALREFAERQSLLAAWIASRSEAEIIADGADFPEGSLAGHLFSKLKESGEVRLLFLSRMFAGYCVFAFFVANTEHCEARFACASAFDIRSDAAVGKALAELWHCWIATPMKLQTAASEPQALNHLERNFLSYNDLEAASRLRFCADRGGPEVSAVPLHEFIRYPSVTVAELEQSVCRISENIFWYNYPVIFGANVFVASKIVSPDFFLHIDTSRRLNFSNRFAVFAGLDYSRFDYSPTCLP